MSASRSLTAAIAVGSIAALTLFAAAPASAATLPSGQVISVIDSFEWQYYDANPATAALTPFGTQTPYEDDFINAVDVNDDGYGYAIADYAEGGAYLYNADANTGTLSNDIRVYFDYGDVVEEADTCSALDFTGGVIYAACYLEAENFDATYVGPVDPETGYLTPVIELAGEDYLDIEAIAVHPVTGVLYAFSYDFSDVLTSSVYTLSEDAGATFVVDLDNPVFGADFDRDGQLWVTSWVFEGDSEAPEILSALATLDLTTGLNPFLEPFSVDGVVVDADINPITVWGVAVEPEVPVLAATGLDQAPLVAIGAALLLGGAVVLSVIRVRRSAVQR
ncbi:hypothetical protein M2152_000057 [Microbacteriaceae bacterium SG_E_30_P1]|uniref:Uncharacterized protein n=1 Tax=Antiquaquibacter oligotrophicus TaxID=2880260 RepID=A0ABT6KJM6_9MICO|nr:hypothetical protein [Antiquaquibacter oligotrophicus]MDH6179875.1 hypothetical protein [Antiquaquibacter oligotrophicus]UDF14364.1 hypothetical protein LH407_05745 [Antiquaquibacter oligotrophicus]